MNRCCLLVVAALSALCTAQDRLPKLPGYANYTANRGKARQLVKLVQMGSWDQAGDFKFSQGGASKVYRRSTNSVETVGASEQEPLPMPTPQEPGRGRQFSRVTAPDGKVAQYRDGNITLVMPDKKEIAVTTDGSLQKRVKYGIASWVYGEELEQRDAMGFSPDSSKLWYFRFDESSVVDSFFLASQRTAEPKLLREAYPKPGKPNPKVSIFVYDVASGKSVQVQTMGGDGEDGVGHYSYAASWRADSKALLFHRMDRRQQVLEFCSANPTNGNVTVLDKQVNKSGWVEFVPLTKYSSFSAALGPTKLLSMFEDTGYFNIGVVDLEKGGRTMLTMHPFDVLRIVRVDAAAKTIDYLTDNPEHPYHQQLWRVGWDGKGDHRITDPTKHHSVSISPDGKLIADRAESPTEPPVLQIVDASGKTLKVLAESDDSAFKAAGYSPVEWFPVKAKDGETIVYGHLHKPKDFDPNKKYPVIFSVYGGPLPPAWGSPAANWGTPDDRTNFGFLWVEVLQRDGQGRGRKFRQAIYGKLGGPEIDDMASIALELAKRPYVDAGKIGIEGTSYGGYASALALLRYPTVFAAACSCSAVTDYRYYDSTYTERYMGLLSDNEAGYTAGSCMTYAKDLKGRLLLYFGTADDNVHQNNSLSLIEALRRARKNIEVQIGTDFGHSGIDSDRMMEFFIERMVLDAERK
ncbi:MAG: DPP IV N-terminal domain-containing protein [Armatimonadetes bacterium]|nr:DPP IV N-terminal domain-containing protein [Armatimonadota bacterium]